MTQSQTWLAGLTLGLTSLMLFALWALVWSHRKSEAEVLLLGVPTGEIAVSLGSLGVVAALAFSGVFDAKIAGTLLGAHVGYHAAASKRR
jgi:hypothetical protein